MTHSALRHPGLSVSLNQPFDEVIQRVKDAFKAEGFGVLCEIDVCKTLQDKIGEQIEPYTILGMCNPHLASRAIKAEHEVGLLLPCNVLVHECGGHVHVHAQDPSVILDIAENELLSPVASEAEERIERAITALRA